MKNESLKAALDNLYRTYSASQMICPPDKYQFLKNELIDSIAEFLLIPYLKKKESDSKIKIMKRGKNER